MYELRRRAAEWRDIEFNIDKLNEYVKTKDAGKWVDDDDKDVLKIVSEYLEILLRDVRIRYRDVLSDQIMESFPKGIKNEIPFYDPKELENEQVH